jgi:ribosomal protein S18 acetylase RimI-like enzyme
VVDYGAEVRIACCGPERIGVLEPLYRALHAHHVTVAPDLAGMATRPADEAWRARRGRYERWLAEPGAFVAIASREQEAVGYALVSLGEGLQGWASGGRIADVLDLAVLPQMRGQGIGTALLDAVEARLRETGIERYRLLVLAANADAARFYARRGLEVVSHVMLGRVP